MVVPGIEENQVPGADIVLFAAAPKMPFTSLHKAYDVIFVEMIGEFLHDPAQIVGFYLKVLIIIGPALFLLLYHFDAPFKLLFCYFNILEGENLERYYTRTGWILLLDFVFLKNMHKKR